MALAKAWPGDADVFDRVVAVDVQIARAFDVHVDQAVARDLVQHVVEKPIPEFRLALPVPSRLTRTATRSLGRVALHLGNARQVHHQGDGGTVLLAELSFSAASIWAFSSRVPTVRRRQLCSKGCMARYVLDQHAALLHLDLGLAGVAHAAGTHIGFGGPDFCTPSSWARASISGWRSARMAAACSAYRDSCCSAKSPSRS